MNVFFQQWFLHNRKSRNWLTWNDLYKNFRGNSVWYFTKCISTATIHKAQHKQGLVHRPWSQTSWFNPFSQSCHIWHLMFKQQPKWCVGPLQNVLFDSPPTLDRMHSKRWLLTDFNLVIGCTRPELMCRKYSKFSFLRLNPLFWCYQKFIFGYSNSFCYGKLSNLLYKKVQIKMSSSNNVNS